MRKADALALFDNKPSKLAAACNLSRPAISRWPDELSDAMRDRVHAALWRRFHARLTQAAAANDVPGMMSAAADMARVAIPAHESAEAA